MGAVGLLVLMPVLLALADLALGFTFGLSVRPSEEWLNAIHVTGCIWAGTAAGATVLSREQRDNTLWAIQLLSLTPGRVLWFKLWIPLYGLALTWMAGIPVFLMAVLLELTSASGAGAALATAAWAGGIALPLTLLSTGLIRVHEAVEPRPPTDTVEALRGLSALGLWIAALALGITLFASPDRMPFFGLRISAWPFAWVLLVLTWLGAVAHGVGTFSGVGREHSGHPCLTLFTLLCVTLGGAGAAWGRVPVWVGAALALAVAVVIIAWVAQTRAGKGQSKRKSEDKWSIAELNWIAGRCENPLLLRDLRAGIRSRSFRRTWLYQALSAPFVIGCLYLVVVKFSLGFGPISWMLNGPLINGLGSLASTNWTKDKSNGTLPLLKLCPLSGRELLMGRMVASFSREAPPAGMAMLVLLTGLGWLLSRGFWIAAPMALAFVPLLAVTSVWSACHSSASDIDGSFYYGVLRTIAIAGIPVGIAVLFALRDSGPLPCFAVAGGFAAYNGWFATQVFSEYARRFELSRTLDLEPSSE